MTPHLIEHISEFDMMLVAVSIGLIGAFSFAVAILPGRLRQAAKFLLGLALVGGMVQGALALSNGEATLEKEIAQFCTKGSHLYNEVECKTHRDAR